MSHTNKIIRPKSHCVILQLFVLTCFPLIFININVNAQEKKFAGFTFRLNEANEKLFLENLETFEKSNILNDRTITKFAATFPIIEPILKEANLPNDFKFLSIYHKYRFQGKEKPNAGFWGITGSSAKTLKLLLTDQIDERKHLILSTEAMAKKMALEQKDHSNWAKILYDHLTTEKLEKSILLDRQSSILTLDHPKYANLIHFLAFKNFIETQFIRIGNQEHTMFYQYKHASGKTFSELSEKLSLDMHEIISDNQWLKEGHIPMTYPVFLYIPVARYYEIKKIDDSDGLNPEMESGFPIVVESQILSKGLGGTFYTINGLPGIQAEMGDKFINLAYKADISHKKFLEYNDMQPMDNVFVGHIYYLKEKKNKADIPYHIARKEETLWDIAQQYGVKLNKLLQFNHLNGITKLMPGQLIWMQEKRPKNEAIQYVTLNPRKEEATEAYPTEVITTEPIPVKVNTYNFTASTENNPLLKENVFVVPAQKETHLVSADTPKEEKSIPEEIKPTKKKFLVHRVEEGDTIASISRKYDVTIKQIVTLNNLVSPKIEIGDKIIIKRN